MAKEIIAVNPKSKLVYRIMGKLIFIKGSSNKESGEIENQLRSKGAIVVRGKEWLKVDMFKDATLVKLGAVEMDLTSLKENEIEEILANFYLDFFKMSGYRCEVNDI